MLQSLPTNSSSSSVNFHFPISPLLVHKIILTIPFNTRFLYNSAIFHHPLFAYNHPKNLHQKYFPTSNVMSIQAASRYQEVREYWEDWHCLISPFFLKVWTVIAGLTHNHWFFITQTQKIDMLQVWQTIQSAFSHTLNLFSLSTNTTTRTHISLKTICLIWFSSYVQHYYILIMPLSTHMFRNNPLLA